ncbi:MAG: histone deacetylase family protein, partial [Paracoccaceae bacterium]
MRAFFDDRQWAHDPKHFVSSGQLTANPEQPKRIEILSQGAKEANCKFETPKDFGMGPISDIHS